MVDEYDPPRFERRRRAYRGSVGAKAASIAKPGSIVGSVVPDRAHWKPYVLRLARLVLPLRVGPRRATSQTGGSASGADASRPLVCSLPRRSRRTPPTATHATHEGGRLYRGSVSARSS